MEKSSFELISWKDIVSKTSQSNYLCVRKGTINLKKSQYQTAFHQKSLYCICLTIMKIKFTFINNECANRRRNIFEQAELYMKFPTEVEASEQVNFISEFHSFKSVGVKLSYQFSEVLKIESKMRCLELSTRETPRICAPHFLQVFLLNFLLKLSSRAFWTCRFLAVLCLSTCSGELGAISTQKHGYALSIFATYLGRGVNRSQDPSNSYQFSPASFIDFRSLGPLGFFY